VRVELYADPLPGAAAVCAEMERGTALAGASNAFPYAARVPADRPSEHFTVRVVPCHAEARVPLECTSIVWEK
jgi:starch phosphorylase